MELREWAEYILFSPTWQEKCRPPEEPLTDRRPGPSLRLCQPTRCRDLEFAPRRTAPAMPRPHSLSLPQKRGVAHHILANHELQALEVMAWTLLVFPEAPSDFRMGLAAIIRDEQRHTRMHAERAALLGVPFGSYPVNHYIWDKAQQFQNILDYLAGLPLTFEGRNLDHTLEFERHFLDVGDQQSAAIMQVIHRDEIRHVAFGYAWLRQLKPTDLSPWEVYAAHLHWPVRPDKAVGRQFHRAPRVQAGLDEDFIEQLARVAAQLNS